MAGQTIRGSFHHLSLTGCAYDVGKMQGEIIGEIPGWNEFMKSGLAVSSKEHFQKAYRFFQQYCPQVNEEIQGMADAMLVSPEEIVYYAQSFMCTSHCSHFVLLPSQTKNGHVMVGRNFDWGNDSDDMRLCTTHIDGSLAHIGFSTMLFGRSEGMNEHGFSVTTSSGGIPVGVNSGLKPALQDGFQFWVLVRVLLEQCSSVQQALDIIDEFPICGNPVLILAERDGRAALVELYGAKKAVKIIDEQSSEQFLCAANHYALPAMQSYQESIMNHSAIRKDWMTSQISHSEVLIASDQAKELLSTPYPAGLCCHFYSEYFGTLHSMLFDLNSIQAEVCFGSPAVNPWYSTGLLQKMDDGEIFASLPQETSTEDFWQSVQP